MENNLKKEFEVYIKYLTTAVSKEIYLEDLKKEVEDMQGMLEEYKRITKKQEVQIQKMERRNQMIMLLLAVGVTNLFLGAGILLCLLL